MIFESCLLMSSAKRALFTTALAITCALIDAQPVRADEVHARGAEVYKTLCASCHGADGMGTKDNYPDPLIGDRSVGELTTFIEKNMPEDEPGKCAGEDAKAVAAYIHEAFYSPAAQARNRPARVELARLTVGQYLSSVADLVGSFRSAQPSPADRGLRGEYFRSRRFRGDNRVLERTDPQVKFDFGETSPVPDKLDPFQFSIRWEGSLWPPETADYELIVRTEHAARLWVNDKRQPLIDAWVQSGSQTEHRATIRLLAGRAYPLKLEFSKSQQGVADKQKKPDKPPKASIELAWKLPSRAIEPIPERCLAPQNAPEVFVASTRFPPDDRSYGYERATSISKAWEQATTDGAIEAAAYIAARLDELAGVAASAPDREPRLREFCGRFAERAFRRPLSDGEKQLYIERQFAKGGPPEAAVKRSLLLVLKSPRFLYRELAGQSGDQYDVASRLSFALWDSLPDEALLKAAAAGELATREQVVGHAERMLGDARARVKLREFFWRWFRADQAPELAKDPKEYPAFTVELATDLRTSLELLIDEVLWSESSDFRQLFLAEALPVNGRLAQFYGLSLPADAPFQRAPLDAGRRAGVVTHPYLLASFAYTATSSPIHRGVFISRNLLGRPLRPPPEAVAPLSVDAKPELTTRQRVELQTGSQTCMSCHAMINPLGFTLEHFDAVGRFRSEEKGKPIDSSGTYVTRAGQAVQFKDFRELAQYLADNEETRTAFVEQLFHYLIKQPIRAHGAGQLAELRKSFEQNGFHMRKLAAEIATAAALKK
jgi:mono/diheme cytochrome c family protein